MILENEAEFDFVIWKQDYEFKEWHEMCRYKPMSLYLRQAEQLEKSRKRRKSCGSTYPTKSNSFEYKHTFEMSKCRFKTKIKLVKNNNDIKYAQIVLK